MENGNNLNASTWTKADRERVAHVLDLVREQTGYRHERLSDEQAQCFNEALVARAPVIVVRALRSMRPHRPEVDRARKKLADRIERDGLPPDTALPLFPLMRDVVAQLGGERVAERERAEAEQLDAVERAKPIEPAPVDHEREKRQLMHAIIDTIQRGEVHVSRFDAEPFNCECRWSDVADVTTWQQWARQAADARGVAQAWDRCTASPDLLRVHVGPISIVWEQACAALDLPSWRVLDLRGIPTTSGPGNIPDERWLTALRRMIERSDKGLVLLVDCEAWVVARLLPQRVGTRA